MLPIGRVAFKHSDFLLDFSAAGRTVRRRYPRARIHARTGAGSPSAIIGGLNRPRFLFLCCLNRVDQRRGLYAARQYSLNLKIGDIADLSLSNLAEGVRQPFQRTAVSIASDGNCRRTSNEPNLYRLPDIKTNFAQVIFEPTGVINGLAGHGTQSVWGA
jgi:hypothetical protein